MSLPVSETSSASYQQVVDPGSTGSTSTVPSNYDCATPEIEQKLANYLESAGQQSSVSAEIFRIAEQQGIKVTVLTNEEYDKRYPGTGGVTTGPADAREIFLPERSIEDPANTSLEHELMHAYVETDSSPGKTLYEAATSPWLPTFARQAAAAQLFESIGGTKEQGLAWFEGLEGIPQSVIEDTGDHMLNSATDRLIYRQKAGQSLDTPETLTVMRNAARGEAAMHLQNKLKPDEDGNQPSFWTVLSVHSQLRDMYGDQAPDFRGSTDLLREEMIAFLQPKIDDFNATRDAYATN